VTASGLLQSQEMSLSADQPSGDQPSADPCPACANAEKLGGALRCRVCGRWVPHVDRGQPGAARFTAGYPDRRARTRQPDPPCPTCRPDQARPRVTIRLPQRIFFKCDTCHSVWTLELWGR